MTPPGTRERNPAPGEEIEADVPERWYQRWLHRLARPVVLFPLVAVLSLAAVWALTLNLIQIERDNARDAARSSSRELLDTYEAQVVRAMREIDQTLRALQYAYRTTGEGEAALSDLRDQELLPPELVFTVTLVDENGRVRASTGSPEDAVAVGEPPPFTGEGPLVDSLVVSRPVRSSAEGWRLRFSRPLLLPDGSFAGTVTVAVDASFFVSGYEESDLGEQGVLGLLGTDGVFRALRTGDSVSAGTTISYSSVIPDQPLGETRVRLTSNPWDGVSRYTSSRELYEYPLAVVVGLSAAERMAPVDELSSTYVFRAAAGSVLILLVITVLGRTNWKLERVRERENQARAAHAKRVEHLAYHDSLTGLPNRSLLGRLLETSVSQARRHDRSLAVLFLDLDRFKEINDTLGHEAGDRLLVEVAERLESSLRESDVVARMGGDEFVVLIPELETEDQAAKVARKILDELRGPFDILGQRFRLMGSVGISMFPDHGDDKQALLKNADIAMYRAKDGGRNDFRFFAKEMSPGTREKIDLESSLRHALEREEFELHYQARRDLATDRITGVEALLRWRHPERGLVEPMEFIPLATESGLIVPIGRWVLKTACSQNVAWQEEGLPPMAVAVNLNARQFFDPNLVDAVRSVLEETGLEPGLLELEICESILAQDAQRTAPVLNALKELGVQITIDNFGTGYSSLSMLRKFPLDHVKVDRSFIRETGHDRVDDEVSDAIVTLGRTLGSSLVAQGVETREQAEYLRMHACDQVQGFYYDRPTPAAEITEMLASIDAGRSGGADDTHQPSDGS